MLHVLSTFLFLRQLHDYIRYFCPIKAASFGLGPTFRLSTNTVRSSVWTVFQNCSCLSSFCPTASVFVRIYFCEYGILWSVYIYIYIYIYIYVCVCVCVCVHPRRQYMPEATLWDVAATDGGNLYKGTDKSLARPGRKQATATEDFDFHISFL